MKDVDVLSLFDGMSNGQIALNKLNINVGNYYASEIKEHAIKVTKHNYPNTIHIGNVLDLDFEKYKGIDLLIGGSPCQDFSRGNKERKGLEGLKSRLFYKWLEAKEVCKPKYFLLENVVMDIEDSNYITQLLGVMPIRINSYLVSGQLRDRLYWTNIPGLENDLFGKCIGLPKDKGILLSDILESGYCPMNKSRCLLESDSRPLSTPIKMFHRFYSTGFTTLIFETKKHYEDCKMHYDSFFKECSAYDIDEILKLDKIEGVKDNAFDGVRYLNQRELERLQTVPEGYTSVLSRNDAACLLGDGWTVDVITHIFKGLENE